jgi:hypothetical protein
MRDATRRDLVIPPDATTPALDGGAGVIGGDGEGGSGDGRKDRRPGI